MTKVTLHYDLARPLTEPELGSVASLPSIFGIARVQVAPGLDKLVVDYDASRMMKTAWYLGHPIRSAIRGAHVESAGRHRRSRTSFLTNSKELSRTFTLPACC